MATNAAKTTASHLIGQPVDRVDGVLKVTGRAKYAYETAPSGMPAYGFIRGAAIGKGRIATIDTSAAEKAPGVIMVMTHRNAPAQPEFGPPRIKGPVFVRARPVLANDQVTYFDQPVALVVAETFEAARSAAALIRIDYARDGGVFDVESHVGDAYRPETINAGMATDTAVGNFDQAFADAPVTINAEYRTPFENHCPMEPHATLASWSGDELTLHTSTQTIANIRAGVSATLQIPPEKVRVISPYVGGGFGSKLIPHAEAILAALAARSLRRPVKVALTRQQMFANAGHRPMMLQSIRLGADRQGKLSAIGHDVVSSTARAEEFAEQTATSTRSLYAAPNRRTSHRLVRMDVHRGEWMRAPGEAPGMLAFECAMDELAVALEIDPIELRIRNEPDRDPERNVPFSTRNLIACMREGVRRFGWDKRPATPASRREGRTLIGYGMSSAIRPNYFQEASARASISKDGQVIAQCDMTDIGTGTYTILTQIAAETLGVPIDTVKVQLGDSSFPRTPGSGGSWGAATSGSAVHAACTALKQKLLEAARQHEKSPLKGVNTDELNIVDGQVLSAGRRMSVADLVGMIAPEGLSADGKVAAADTYKTYSQHAFGAHFAEVGVDCDTGEIRLRRMLGVFAAGRILNAKTARSQLIGGMIWGVGAALLEEGVIDKRYGQFVNHDLAEYHVAVNADVPKVDAVFVEEYDDKTNPLGSKGIGELGICGAGASVANAVYNATGIRVREFPITLDKLLPDMPLVAI